MTHSILIAVAGSISLLACSGDPAAIRASGVNPYQPIPNTPSLAIVAGRVTATIQGTDTVVSVRDDHGDVHRMVGSQAATLATVNGGDVIAFGTWDANPGFVVQDFEVVGMLGRPALDGVLEALDTGYALRMANGSIRPVPGLTSECADYVGARLWVIGWEEGKDVVFGPIGAA